MESSIITSSEAVRSCVAHLYVVMFSLNKDVNEQFNIFLGLFPSYTFWLCACCSGLSCVVAESCGCLPVSEGQVDADVAGFWPWVALIQSTKGFFKLYLKTEFSGFVWSC